jgi:hypothetical protein
MLVALHSAAAHVPYLWKSCYDNEQPPIINKPSWVSDPLWGSEYFQSNASSRLIHHANIISVTEIFGVFTMSSGVHLNLASILAEVVTTTEWKSVSLGLCRFEICR